MKSMSLCVVEFGTALFATAFAHQALASILVEICCSAALFGSTICVDSTHSLIIKLLVCQLTLLVQA